MKRFFCALLALLLLAGCGSKAPASPAPTPDPTPEVTAAPATPAPTEAPVETPEPEPEATTEPAPTSKEQLETYLEEFLSRDSWTVYFWLDPGSGPSMATLDSEAFAQTLREQLGDVSDWQPESQAKYTRRINRDKTPFDGIQISFDWPTQSNGLVLNYGPNTAVLQPGQFFYVENMDDICQALLQFCPFEY